MSEEETIAAVRDQSPIRVFQPDGQPLTSLDARFAYALQLLAEAPKIMQGDRSYTTVASRVSVFRRAFGPTAAIVTKFPQVDQDVVRCEAEIWIPNGHERILVASGSVEEFRNAHDLNGWHALANAETSAIGRALAAFGLGGGEFASANELDGAKAAQETSKQDEATQFLTAEEIAAAVNGINACASLDQLAETYLALTPALKVAARAAKESKHRTLKGGDEPKTEQKRGRKASA